MSGDSLSTLAANMAANINSDSALATLGVTATASGAVITITSISPNGTTYTESVTGTETISLSNINNGFLQTVNGPLAGNDDITTFTWNNTGTMASRTNSEGYTRNFSYDNMDRPTQTAYPDGSTDQIDYQNIDAGLFHRSPG